MTTGAALFTVFLLLIPRASASEPLADKTFGGAMIEEVFRVRLDRGDLLLESIDEVIRRYGIQDGAVLTGLGSVQECTFHGVKPLAPKAEQKFHTVRGPVEVLNLNGIIAAGEPHIHITLADMKRSFGGHLEKGCRVLYRAELTIAKFRGTPLARKLNAEGTPALQKK